MSRVGNFLSNLFSGNTAGPQTVLRAYGKLPFYAEYRRLELSPGAPTAFSQWLDAGRLAWFQSAGPQARDASMLPSRVMLSLPGAKECVVGSIWDSRDNVGRIFPFSFFVTAPLEALGADCLERWAAALLLFDAFDRCYAELRVLRSGGDFYKLFQKRALTLHPEDLPDRARSLTAAAAGLDVSLWSHSGSGRSSNPAPVSGNSAAQGLAGAAHADASDALSRSDWLPVLKRRAQKWRQQPDGFCQAAFSIPVAPSASADTQAAVWLRWLDPLSRQCGKPISVIAPAAALSTASTPVARAVPAAGMPPGTEPAVPAPPGVAVSPDGDGRCGFLHVVVRDLIPGDFQLLTSQAADYTFVENLSRTPPPAPGSSSLDLPHGKLLDWLTRNGG